MTRLLNIDANAKTIKGQDKGYLTAVLYLAPYDVSGYQVCPMAKAANCWQGCLNTAGRGGMAKGNATMDANGHALPDNTVQRARIKRTRWFFEDRAGFMTALVAEIEAFIRMANKRGLTPCVRLNGTSDIRWETVPVQINGETWPNLMARFSDVQFYDYTKLHNRKKLPANYHITFSLASGNDEHAAAVLQNGGNVAIVFRDKTLPPMYTIAGTSGFIRTRPVINGDESDLRFLDPAGSIIGLYAKGRAKKDTTGFVRENAS